MLWVSSTHVRCVLYRKFIFVENSSVRSSDSLRALGDCTCRSHQISLIKIRCGPSNSLSLYLPHLFVCLYPFSLRMLLFNFISLNKL